MNDTSESVIRPSNELADDLRRMACTLVKTGHRQHLAWEAADEIERLQVKIASLDNVIDYWKGRAGDGTAPETRALETAVREPESKASADGPRHVQISGICAPGCPKCEAIKGSKNG